MPYESLITTLLEEGATRRRAIVDKARAEAERILADAAATADALAREVESQINQEVAQRRAVILDRASLSVRHILLQAKHEVLDAVWRRAAEVATSLPKTVRTQLMQAILEELLAHAPAGPLTARIDEREAEYIEPILRERGVAVERRHCDDLLLGAEVEASGERLRSSLVSRLAKARPELLVELNRMLFR